MSEMVERVAKAIEGAVVGDIGMARIAARAAIEAMREPTEAMTNEVYRRDYDDHGVSPKSTWQIMIDEALK